ncbi:MAG: hypothetical protein ABUS79_08720 [Pseudomonadota bacterium]
MLDTMIVSYFLEVDCEQELANAAKAFPMTIVEEVRRELRNHKTRGGKNFDKWLATSNIEVRSIVVGSPASVTLAQLLRPEAPADGRGERASIALAASDPSLTFVTHDNAATIMAVRELWTAGERVLGLAAFLRRLFDNALVTNHDAAQEIMSLAYAAAPQWPTWWATWRAAASASK